MIDHISLGVSDFQRSRAFYETAPAPLGCTQAFSNDQEQYAGFAGPDRERTWIGLGRGAASPGWAHIAILTKDRATVRKFYEAAMKAGARDNGVPGPRPQYSPMYY
jgi:catechol 2,3-dioxygenase-like lactoylglutathione lyase family enzyme